MQTAVESPREVVASNVAAIRRRRGLSVRALSERMTEIEMKLLPSGITKIEQGQRGVDVDELIALAVALNVSPTRLLLPDAGYRDWVQVTPSVRAQGWQVWEWLTGQAPLPAHQLPSAARDRERAFSDEQPGWLRDVREHSIYRALAAWLLHAGRMIPVTTDTGRPDMKMMADVEVRQMTAAIGRLNSLPPTDGEQPRG